MEKSRLEVLREIIQSRPDDAFSRYGLAMELAALGQTSEAWEHFNYLLTRHPDYCPVYYQAAKLLVSQGRGDAAREILVKGAEVAARQRNFHAQSELQAALEQLKEAS